MPTALNVTALVHLYEPPKTIGTGERTGAAFSGYHKTKIKDANKEWADHYTSIRGTIWGKEAEWLVRDGQKGTLVICSGMCHVEKYEKDGKHGATLKIDCQTARIAERKEDGERQPVAERPAPAPRAATGAAGADDSEPPFLPFTGCDSWG